AVLVRDLTVRTARIVQRADMVLGAAALVLLVAGLTRVFHYEKGWAYYSSSLPFIAKFSLFILVALLSIYPTLVFLSWRRPLRLGEALTGMDNPMPRLSILIYIEIVGEGTIILGAPPMATGNGRLAARLSTATPPSTP